MFVDQEKIEARKTLEGIIGMPLRLEDLISDPKYFGLTTLTPLQRAFCRAVQGEPLGDLWYDETPYADALPPGTDYFFDTGWMEDYEGLKGLPNKPNHTVKDIVRAAFNYTEPIPGAVPTEVTIVAAVRTFKSLLAAAVAIVASQIADLSHILDEGGEIPRYSILSLEIDNAKDVHRHIIAAFQKSSIRHLRVTEKEVKRSGNDEMYELMRESRSYSVGSTFVRHPSGRIVELRVVAGKRAGGSLVSKWSIGCTLDEAPRMVGASEGVVNLEDARKAVISRLLPGAQLLKIGSPWAPFGPVYEEVENDFGNPTTEKVVLVGTGPALNPFWWSTDRCHKLREADHDHSTFKTDVLAQFADAEQQLFPEELIDSCCRETDDDIPWKPGHDYAATMDPATRGNAWTFAVGSKIGGLKQVVAVREWVPTALKRLSPRLVLAEIAEVLAQYRLSWAYSDEWAADALRDMAAEEGFTLIDEPMRMHDQIRFYMGLAAEMSDGKVELANNENLRKDFKFVRKRPTQKGATIALLHTPDGRHADFAPTVMRLFKRWISDPEDVPPPEGTPEWFEYMDELQAEKEIEAQINELSTEWWEE